MSKCLKSLGFFRDSISITISLVKQALFFCNFDLPTDFLYTFVSSLINCVALVHAWNAFMSTRTKAMLYVEHIKIRVPYTFLIR